MPSLSLSNPSLHCTTGGGGGVEVSPVQVVFGGLSRKALLSVTTQPTTSRLRTVTEIGVGVSRVPPGMPLPSQGSVMKVKPCGALGTVTVMEVDERAPIAAALPVVGLPKSTCTLEAKF